jgi:1,2-diacylglycerol 3-beta-glucosyltransferase
MSSTGLDLGLSLAALPALAAAAYVGLLAVIARRKPVPRPSPGCLRRMIVVVPAHDEEAGIAETVGSLRCVDYPREEYRILVVADNCSDRTAEEAREAGADVVLVRQDPGRRGKGYALRFAFDSVLEEGFAESVVVVDADTVVSPNLLTAFAARFADGALALQAHYGVRNAGESWRTRLLAIAFGAFHGVRSLARERLGLSCGLRGNGMGFTVEVLRAVPYEAWSIVEDLEYGIQLAYAGHRVWYVDEARVLGQMASTERASRSQRRRWEGGRRRMAAAHAGALLRRASRERSAVLLDLALDLLVPPLSTIVLVCGLGVVATATALASGVPLRLAPWLWSAAAVGLGVYVMRGWALSGVGVRGLVDLLAAPAYITWRVALSLWRSPHRGDTWVRTERPGDRP